MDTNTHPVAAAWGEQIKAQRTLIYKMSRADLAAKLGVSRQMVRLWEEGVHAPSPRMQGALIRELGIHASVVAQLIQQGSAAAGNSERQTNGDAA